MHAYEVYGVNNLGNAEYCGEACKMYLAKHLVRVIVFILNLASYTSQRVNYNWPGFYSRIHEIIGSGGQTQLAIAMLLTLKENGFLAMMETLQY